MATKIYIAGKITGDPDYKAKFEEAENFYKKKGFTVDVVAFLPDFKQSAGAEVEHAYCRYIDKNIRHYEDDRNKAQCAAKISADLLTSKAAPVMPDPVEEIKKAIEEELQRRYTPTF